MSKRNASHKTSVLRRTVTSHDKFIISAALVTVAFLGGFVYWFVTSPEPTQLKWATVGLLVGSFLSLVFVSVVVPCLFAHHFMVEAGRMTVITWFLLLLLYIAIAVLSVITFNYFFIS